MVLARVMSEIHQEFGLARKVVGTTTDNGANYVAAFRHYAVEEEPMDEPEEDPDVVVPEVGDLDQLL